MIEQSQHENMVEDIWRTFLTHGHHTKELRYRRIFKFLPNEPRCRFCFVPFSGVGATLVKLLFDKRPATLNPRLCNTCEKFAKEFQGGAEVKLSLLFADVRGSTTLAESMSTSEYSQLINRFYTEVSDVLIQTDALIDKLIGDQAAGIYVPGFAGQDHAGQAVAAAKKVLKVTGHQDAGGPWIPLGVAVHTGTAFVGSVGTKDGTSDITVLGDTANITARLASKAKPGELLISESASRHAGLQLQESERQELALKGKSESVAVYRLKP